jgi:hypothetical protein
MPKEHPLEKHLNDAEQERTRKAELAEKAEREERELNARFEAAWVTASALLAQAVSRANDVLAAREIDLRFSFRYIPEEQIGKLYILSIDDASLDDPTIDDVYFHTAELNLGFKDGDVVITNDEDIAASLSDEDLDQLLTGVYKAFAEAFEE